jgi:uncharacterized membrane protein
MDGPTATGDHVPPAARWRHRFLASWHQDRQSYVALLLALLSVLPLASAFIPDFYQEAFQVSLMGLLGLVLAIVAAATGAVAAKAKRHRRQGPWIAFLAIGIASIPLLAGILLVVATVACTVGASCGTG